MRSHLVNLARLGAVGCALLSGGCYKMTIVNGKPPAPAPVLEDKWRSTVALDIVAIDTPIALDGVCKETGWAKIHQSLTPVDWFIDGFAGGLYESNHASVWCALGSGAPPVAVPVQQAPGGASTGTPNMPPPTPPSQPPPRPGGTPDRSL